MWHWLMLHFLAYAIVPVVSGIQQQQQQENFDTLPLLRRQRRYLIFEQGATIIVQGNIAKAILGTTPRGLNEITEWTLTYALPTSLDAVRPKAKARTTTKKPLPIFNRQKWLKKAYVLRTKRPLVCPKRYPYGGAFIENSCKFRRQNGKQRRRRLRRFSLTAKQGKHSLLLDVLTKLAEFHAYQPRHCIMRLLCESHHLLESPGVSLFHDALRVLIKYAWPLLQSNAAFIKAYAADKSLYQCAELYGPHCRHSFLVHFTQVFHAF